MNLSSLYISPLASCNLHCKICYTKKTPQRLTAAQIQDFIDRYRRVQRLDSITFCGGEVFLLSWFVKLVNQLTADGLLVEIITNGTIDCLDELTDPNLTNLIISLDGCQGEHDANRGKGSFNKTWQFLLKARRLGFHTQVFTVVTSHNFNQLDAFESWLRQELGELPEITYHPRKPLSYLQAHPLDNCMGSTQPFGFLDPEQLAELANNRTVFPPVKLGCHQLSLMSDGRVYGCCEGTRPIGHINDPVKTLLKRYQTSIGIPAGYNKHNCLGCSEPKFVCGRVFPPAT